MYSQYRERVDETRIVSAERHLSSEGYLVRSTSFHCVTDLGTLSIPKLQADSLAQNSAITNGLQAQHTERLRFPRTGKSYAYMSISHNDYGASRTGLGVVLTQSTLSTPALFFFSHRIIL